jgi:hypothetical protein
MSEHRDVLELLAALNPVPADRFANAAETDDARALLARILATEPEGRRVRHPRVPRRLIASAAAVTVLSLAVLALFIWQPFGGGVPQPASAAQVLHHVASVAASRTVAGSGDVAYTKEEEFLLDVHEKDGWSVILPATVETWVAPDGSGRQREVPGTPTFPSAADKAAWEASGSPELGHNGVFDRAFDPGFFPRPDLSSYPTDVEALKARIQREAAQVGGVPLNVEMFTKVGDLLRSPDASPALRSALYQVAAGIPGVELVGGVTDQVGRKGTEVAIVSDYAGYLARYSLIFDPSTSALLEHRETYLEPRPGVLASPPFFGGGTVYLSQELVSAIPTSRP